jgi:hypothetical protein
LINNKVNKDFLVRISCISVLDDEDLDEETLAMKAMGLPTSFTSSIVIYVLEKMLNRFDLSLRLIDQNLIVKHVHNFQVTEQLAFLMFLNLFKFTDESSIENTQEDLFKNALDDWLEYWNRDGYQLATDTWTSNVDLHNRSDEPDTSHSSDDSLSNPQSEQVLTDLWREHYLSTYDKSLREYCSNHELDYEQFVGYISNIYGENDVRTKTINQNDVKKNVRLFSINEIFIFSQLPMMMKRINE